jgi:hypothetical protein
MLALLLLGGCVNHSIQTTDIEAAQNPRHHIDEFDAIAMATSIDTILKTFGQPDRNVGSGISILVYDLDDGSMMQIGSADGKTLLYLDPVFPDEKTTFDNLTRILYVSVQIGGEI